MNWTKEMLSNPYPFGTRRENALMLLWFAITPFGSKEDLWATKPPSRVGLTEKSRIRTGRRPASETTRTILRIAEREKWRYKGRGKNFNFKSGMKFGEVLDAFGVK